MLDCESFFGFQLAFCLLFRIKIQIFVQLNFPLFGKESIYGRFGPFRCSKIKMIMSLLILLESKQQKKIRLGKSMLSF